MCAGEDLLPIPASSMGVAAAGISCARVPSPLAPRGDLVSRRALKGRVAMELLAAPPPAASFRVDRIGGHVTEVLEVRVERPAFHVLFVPGNPGIVAYYREFLENLFVQLDGHASVTAISHIAHVSKDWELGKSFSLQEQINHKVQFVRDTLLQEAPGVPLLLVGHSIGAYIALEMLKEFPSQVQHVIGLYPFVMLNKHSKFQSVLGKVAASPALCTVISTFAGLLGRLPKDLSRVLVKVMLGREWDPLAVDVTCRYLLQKNVVDNFLYMGRTEFAELPSELDWNYLKENQNKASFLFGIDDHWGPLSLLDEAANKFGKGIISLVTKPCQSGLQDTMRLTKPDFPLCHPLLEPVYIKVVNSSREVLDFDWSRVNLLLGEEYTSEILHMDEKMTWLPMWQDLLERRSQLTKFFGQPEMISKKLPELQVATEREGHLHAFCCTRAGSKWVAGFAANTISSQTRCDRM